MRPFDDTLSFKITSTFKKNFVTFDTTNMHIFPIDILSLSIWVTKLQFHIAKYDICGNRIQIVCSVLRLWFLAKQSSL